jgi:hypothetical protein
MKTKLFLGIGVAAVATVLLAQAPIRSWVSTATTTVTRTRVVNRVTCEVLAGVPQSLTILYTDTKADTNGVLAIQPGEWTLRPADVAAWRDTLASGNTNTTKVFFSRLFTTLDGIPEQAVLAWDKPERVTASP